MVVCCTRQERYSSFKNGIGAKIEKGTASLEDLHVSDLSCHIFHFLFFFMNHKHTLSHIPG